MSTNWAINGQSLAALGLEFAGGTFNTGTASIMTLRRVADMDEADVLAWGAAVTLTRDGVPFFQGKVDSLPTSATGTSEGQDIEIVDAWQELEQTTYKESWGAGAGSVMLPVAILGRRANGSACTDAEQIREAVDYAASVGVAIQMGSVPAGLPLWQTEVRNITVAEVIRVSLRFHPDWVPWIDHSTTPPTLNITARSAMATRTIDIAGGEVESVKIRRRDDLKPDAVQILYLNATIIDGTTFRDWIEDRFPEAGPSAGPRVISNVIELAGAQMQFQKQRVQTRPLPGNHGEMRTWLEAKYPQLKALPPGDWIVRQTAEVTLIPPEEDEKLPAPINPRARRITVTEVEDLPRELVAGSIEDWMRRKTGMVHVPFKVHINPAASAASKKILEPLASMEGLSVRATNAITKIYKGITQWVDGETAPAGIAEAVYNSLSAYQFEGSITTVSEDVSALRFHGCKISVAGGKAEWAGMGAMVHSVSFDIAKGAMTIGLGPAPFAAAQDIMDLKRMLRGRGVTWMSEAERTSNELGAEGEPGSKGDTVTGFDIPETQPDYVAGIRYSSTIAPANIRHDGSGWKVTFTSAKLWEHSLKNIGKPHDIAAGSGVLSATPPPELPLSNGANEVWLKYQLDPLGEVSDGVALTIGAQPSPTQLQPKRPNGGNVPGVVTQKIGTITVTDANTAPTWRPECTSTKVDHMLPVIEDADADGQSLYHEWGDGKDKFKMVRNADPDPATSEESSDGEPILNEEPAPYSKNIIFARIAQRATDPQVKVKSVGSGPKRKLVLEGNSIDAALSGYIKNLNIKDGMFLSAEADDGPHVGGWWGTVTWVFLSMGSPSDYNSLKLRWEAGRLVNVYLALSESPEVEQPGTEEVQGNVYWNSMDSYVPS
ncbi:hypothetical protein OKA04_23495 [Luteolibacter flavescens]|uniref:Tip attachment protein J domain-containing protein n=1 Tax=Luteolibacter flavescens TaxID=1859460 RepID=A0ABT3FWE4_9BACT|nr:hypothetical protein [Luteolibacter flavescens]MCW1887722.1 hypothetical protein [Luteolibacter flavescens]